MVVPTSKRLAERRQIVCDRVNAERDRLAADRDIYPAFHLQDALAFTKFLEGGCREDRRPAP